MSASHPLLRLPLTATPLARCSFRYAIIHAAASTPSHPSPAVAAHPPPSPAAAHLTAALHHHPAPPNVGPPCRYSLTQLVTCWQVDRTGMSGLWVDGLLVR